jgi:hypothetical protein
LSSVNSYGDLSEVAILFCTLFEKVKAVSHARSKSAIPTMGDGDGDKYNILAFYVL